MKNLLECKFGDVVQTGDSYGYNICVCTQEKHINEHGLTVVTFLNLVNGSQYDSGCKPGGEHYLDYCQRVIDRLSEKQVLKIKEVWFAP